MLPENLTELLRRNCDSKHNRTGETDTSYIPVHFFQHKAEENNKKNQIAEHTDNMGFK